MKQVDKQLSHRVVPFGIGEKVKSTLIIFIIIIFVNTTVSNQVFGQPQTSPPTLISDAAIIIDAKTGKVLFEKESHTKMYPASLTKIATAIYAIEKGDIDETVTVSKKARNVGGSKVYLEEGEQVPLKKLIQGLLINSGNDAAVAIAEHLSGSNEQFASDMNEYLTNEVGLRDTNFKNPHGLFDVNHVTTASDLAKLTQYAMDNKLFREIFGTKELKWSGESWDTTLITHHKLMREMPYKGITGGKTGFVDESGFTLATTAKRKNLSLIVITLDSDQKDEVYNDTISLLDYAFDNFETSSIPRGTVFTLEEQEYKVGKALFYTYSIGDEVEEVLNANGILELINQDGNVITSSSLERIKRENQPETVMAERETNNKKNSTLFKKHSFQIQIFLLFFVIIGKILLLRTSKKKTHINLWEKK
ncbi:MAG TPA: D-alanyl-D-alanine carboxypeptidase family protein [Pseudogracilibacillus sp.]|nr:D-alanyl-D-alanine carboxypeptidase family protein [Pseudogracilibacillus sp.]